MARDPRAAFLRSRARGRASTVVLASLTLLTLLTLLSGCCTSAGVRSMASLDASRRARESALSESRPLSARRANWPALPSGREIAGLGWRECRSLLERASVSFEAVPDDAAPQVHEPVYLLSPLSGVSFGPKNGLNEHAMVDCRLAVALLAWAPILQDAGVVKVEHYSTYRRGARIARSSRSSGHARALAIDAARFHLEDGRVLTVDLDWDDRERGGDPCNERRREDEGGRLLRRVVCGAVAQSLFQVVLTPHHDRAHQNHVHLELVPNVDWTYVR